MENITDPLLLVAFVLYICIDFFQKHIWPRLPFTHSPNDALLKRVLDVFEKDSEQMAQFLHLLENIREQQEFINAKLDRLLNG